MITMNSKFNTILLKNILLAILTASFTVSCTLDEENRSGKTKSAMIEINVMPEGMTKSDPTAQEETISTLRIYAFLGNKQVGSHFRTNVVAGEPFYMDLALPEEGVYMVDFYVIANGEYMLYESGSVTFKDEMSIAELQAIKYTGFSDVMPLYTIKKDTIDVKNVAADPNIAEGHEGHIILNDKVAFQLGRSLAKISMYAAKSEEMSTTPQVLSATLLSGGTRKYSYLFPQESSILNDIPSMESDQVILSTSVDITREIEQGSEAQKDPQNYNLIFADHYLPEVTFGTPSWDQSSGNPREVVLYIEYTTTPGGEINNAYVYLPPIVRNTHYKICTLISADGKITLNYEVEDWITNNTEELTFDYPTHTFLLPKLPTSVDDLGKKPEHPARMSESTPFVGYFQMSYPVNDRWTPTLSGLDASNCEIRVFDVHSTLEVPHKDWPIEASERWYRIEVTPDPSKIDIGKEVRLSITYTASGLEVLEYLMINGINTDYFWPYAGTSQQDANYVIITMVE